MDGEDDELEVEDEERDEDRDLLEERSRLLRPGLLGMVSATKSLRSNNVCL